MNPATAPNPLSSAMSTVSEPIAAPLPASSFLESTLSKLEAEPEPVVEPKPEPKPEPEPVPAGNEDEIEARFPDPGEGETPAARAKWGELKTELKQERRQLREYRTKLEELEKRSAVDPEELAQLKQQLEDRERELSVHRIEGTKEYKETIDKPLQSIGEAAASIARRYKLDQEAVFDALAERDEAKQQEILQGMVDGMSDRDRLRLYQMADDTLLLLRKSDEMRAHSHEALQELEIRQKETAEREAAGRKREFVGTVDKLFDSLEDRIPFHPLASGETKTLVFDKLKSDVLASDFDASAMDVRAYSVAAGVMLPRLVQQMRAVVAENQALKTRLNGLSAAAPVRTPGATTPEPGPARSADFLENVFSNLGA